MNFFKKIKINYKKKNKILKEEKKMKYRTSVLKLLLFIFLLPFAKSQINNVVATINSPVNMASTKGSWNGRLFCKDGGWANSFQVYSDCSWFGLEIIRFFCNSMQGNYISSIDYALDISYYTGTWSPVKSCSSMGYIIGYKTFGCCCGYHANDLSLNDITFICSTGEMITAGVTCNDGHYNGWSSLTLCPSGTAACGFDYKFDNSLTDNTALNDFEMICCRVCNSKSAVYYDMTTICNFCSISCLTCRSDSNTCESCGASDSLVGSVCIQTTNLFKISEEFTGASSTFSSEFSSGGWSTTIFLIGTCANSINTWSYLGNYGDSTISKTVTNLLPHYKIRLKTRFYKIDDWKGESISIKINGVSLPVARLASLGNDDDFYYGNVCQGTGNENTFFIDEETYHTATTITIQYSAAPTFGQYWGFSHVGVYIYRCDSTCFTCSGPNANECNSCYAFSRLSNSNTCKCDDGYYPVVTTNCISLPCTVCNLCFVGCLTCISDSATSCLSCKIDNYFYANQVNFILQYKVFLKKNSV